MKPPICRICDKKMLETDEVGLIYFKKRPSEIQWDEKMNKKGMVGYSPYVEWSCKEHLHKTHELKHLPRKKDLI